MLSCENNLIAFYCECTVAYFLKDARAMGVRTKAPGARLVPRQQALATIDVKNLLQLRRWYQESPTEN